MALGDFTDIGVGVVEDRQELVGSDNLLCLDLASFQHSLQDRYNKSFGTASSYVQVNFRSLNFCFDYLDTLSSLMDRADFIIGYDANKWNVLMSLFKQKDKFLKKGFSVLPFNDDKFRSVRRRKRRQTLRVKINKADSLPPVGIVGHKNSIAKRDSFYGLVQNYCGVCESLKGFERGNERERTFFSWCRGEGAPGQTNFSAYLGDFFDSTYLALDKGKGLNFVTSFPPKYEEIAFLQKGLVDIFESGRERVNFYYFADTGDLSKYNFSCS